MTDLGELTKEFKKSFAELVEDKRREQRQKFNRRLVILLDEFAALEPFVFNDEIEHYNYLQDHLRQLIERIKIRPAFRGITT
jgi:hypothetical protein